MNYRRKANLTLAAVFLLFVFSTVLKLSYPNLFSLRLINFVLEAALVGGIADWFAVTALFQRPLGWPFHTALIPRNRDKVIRSVSDLVENDLLSLELIRQKLSEVSFVKGISEWVGQSGGMNGLTRLIFRYAQERAGEIPPKSAQFLADRIRNGLKESSLAPEALKLVQMLPTTSALDYALEKLHEFVGGSQVRESLYRFLAEQKEAKASDSSFNRYLLSFIQKIDGLNLVEATAVLQNQLGLALQELKTPDHPLRQKIQKILQESFFTPVGGSDGPSESEPGFSQGKPEQAADSLMTLEHWKEEVLLQLPWEETLQNFLAKVLAYGLNLQPSPAEKSGQSDPDSPLLRWLTDGANRLWQSFLGDSQLQNQLDKYIRSTLGRLAAAEHRLIGSIAHDTLEALSEKDLNAFIEGKTGNDLQWIRINGSLVGGIAGLFLFLFLDLVYNPWLVPLVQHLFLSRQGF